MSYNSGSGRLIPGPPGPKPNMIVRNNIASNAGDKALLKAAKENNLEYARKLLRMPGVNKNAQNEDGETALIIAARFGHTDMVQLLLENDVDVHIETNKGNPILYIACYMGKLDIIQLLLAEPRIDVNKKKEGGFSPLFIACLKGHVDVVKLLLAEPRVDVNAQTNGGSSPLHIACSLNKPDIVKLLVSSKRVNVNLQDANGNTALHLTIQKDGDTLMKLLLKRHDIRLSLVTMNNAGDIVYSLVTRIPAIKAEAWKKDSKLKLLTMPRLYIPAGSQNYLSHETIHDFNELVNLPRMPDGRYNSNFGQYLRASNNTRSLRRNPASEFEFPEAQMKTYIARVKPGPPGPKPNMLVRQNIDINHRDAEGNTAFMKAVKAGNTQYVKQLLTIPGIDVNVQDNASHSPLRVACDRNHLAIVKLLLTDERVHTNGQLIASVLSHQLAAMSLLLESPHVNVNEATPNGDTSLMLAIKYGPKIPQIRLLMASDRVDKTSTDRRGLTTLFLAVVSQNPVIQDLFKRPMDNGVLDPAAEGNPEFMDPIYTETETLQSAVDKGYIVVKIGPTYFTLDRDETIKAIREGSSVRYQCKSMRQGGIVRFENVEDTQYVYIQGNGNYLVPLEEFLNALIQYPILEFTSTGRTLPYMSSAQVIQSLVRPTDDEGRPLNRYNQPITLVSADHCQEGTNQVLYTIKGYTLASSATGGASASGGAASGGAASGGAAPRRRKTRSKARVLRKRFATRFRK